MRSYGAMALVSVIYVLCSAAPALALSLSTGNQGSTLEGFTEMPALHALNSNKSLKSGFRFLQTGACTINDNDIHTYGATLAASASIMAVGGLDGMADVQCIVSSCEYAPNLVYSWRSATPGVKFSKSGRGISAAAPSCERGAWVPPTGGRVEVAINDNTVIFGAAGCVEMHKLLDDQSWAKVEYG
ncbi:hypothetical protein T484DRAFT_1767698 [Baffinella frigidus]|nr:hypothetical protein T484DRAFT_1767698 [Cryptophyta sp. CCMP2293]